MVSFLEKQESFTCTLKPHPSLTTPSLTTNYLIISTFGHASTYLFCSAVAANLTPIATISADYHSEVKDVFILYQHKSDSSILVGTTTESFKSQFANDIVRILCGFVTFSRALVLDAMSTQSYQFGKFMENTLLWASTTACKTAIKGCPRIDPGTIIGGISGATLMACEMAKKECYSFLAVMQEYSVGKDSLKVFKGVQEIADFIKESDNPVQIKEVVTAVNSKLENHLFS